MLESLACFVYQSNNTGATDVKIDESILQQNSSFKSLEFSLPSKFDWGFHIISIDQTGFKKTGALSFSMKFRSPEVAQDFYRCSIQPSREYFCHVWAGAY